MKILVVPDVHGHHEWERVKSIPKEDYDYVVFLGDYFDNGVYDRKLKRWKDANNWPDQGENFQNICNWVREDTEHRKICFGNHCWSYMSGTRLGGNCSGHQISKIGEIKALLMANRDILDVAQEFDGWVFSHAGFTKNWVEIFLKPELHKILDKWPEEDDGKGLVWDEKEFSIKFLNEFFHKCSHIPGDENYYSNIDELLDWHGYFSGSGNEVSQGPFWVRPEALLKDAYFKNQVVGHTEFGYAGPVRFSSKDNRIIVTDSATHSNIFIFDTENPGVFHSISTYYRESNKIYKIINDAKSLHKSTDDIAHDIMEKTKYNLNEAKELMKNLII